MAAVLLAAASAAACVSAPRSPDPDPAQPAASVAAEPAQRVSADDCLALLYHVSAADGERLARLHERAAITLEIEPSAEHRLRLGLIKGWPGHAGYDPAAARGLLRAALDEPKALTPGARDLVDVYLKLIDQRERMLRTQQELRGALAEAQQKINALTAIERVVPPTDAGEERDDRKPEAPDPAGR